MARSTVDDAPTLPRGRIVGEALAVIGAVTLAAWAMRADDVWLERHMTRLACATDVADLARLHLLRGMALGLALGLLVWGRPRIGRAVARWSAGKTKPAMAGTLASIAVALALAVVVSDVFLRWRRARTPAPPAIAFNLGVPASVDASGHRLVDGALPEPGRPTILFSGESVAFGWGLPDHDTIPAQVGARLGMQTRNVAVSGSSIDEALLVLREELPRTLAPRAVVTFLLLDWLHRSRGLDRVHLVLDARGRLVRRAPTAPWLRVSPLLEKARSVYHADDVVELARAVLAETARTVRAAGALPLVVVTQCGEECVANGPHGPRILARILEGQDFDHVVVDQDLTLAIANDIHPNRAGAERYAVAIERALRAKGIAPETAAAELR